jgi:hypothetical protein
MMCPVPMAQAEPLSLNSDVAPLPNKAFRASGSAAVPVLGDGFALLDNNYADRPSYTLRLVESPGVESLRGAAETAASEVASAGGVPIVVAAGTVPDTVPDREPAPGEILLSVDDTTPCGPGNAGCGGPRIWSQRPSDHKTVIEGGRMWIYSVVLGYTAAQKQHVVDHELGHALGLAHYEQWYSDGYQVMHPSSYEASGYRAGDRNGLSYLAQPEEARWMSVVPRSSDHDLIACIGTKFGETNCSVPLWASKAGTDASMATLGDGSAVVAFNGTTGNLSECWVTNFLGANCWSSGVPIAAGTSPAIATMTGGGASGTAVAAFNSPSGALKTCRLTSTGPTSCANQGWVVEASSSPSIAALGDGSVAVAFRGGSGLLGECRVTWFGGSSCWSTAVSAAGGPAPGIAELTGGVGAGSAIAAVRIPSGALTTCQLTATGPANCANQGWVGAAGSGPSVAPLADGSAAVGFNGGGNEFGSCRVTWFGGSNCWTSGVGMTVGGSPASTPLSNGAAMAAFRTASGSLGTCEMTTGGPMNCANEGWTMAPGTSPSAIPYHDGSAAVVFEGGEARLSSCRVTDFGGSNCWGSSLTMATTNPQATSIP